MTLSVFPSGWLDYLIKHGAGVSLGDGGQLSIAALIPPPDAEPPPSGYQPDRFSAADKDEIWKAITDSARAKG